MWTPPVVGGIGKALTGAALPVLGNFLGNLFGAGQQSRNNMRLAEYQHKSNMKLLRYQLDYNSPASQMQRFKDAGLNPHLIYGGGSANAGNMESPPRYPDIQPANYQGAFMNLATQAQQLKLMQSQTNLTDTKVSESTVKQDLMRAQKDLVKANPYMKEEYVNAMVLNLKSVAQMKEQQSAFMHSMTQSDVDGVRWQRGFLKMQREIDLLEQRFNLGTADQKVKAEVIQSKEFQNQLQRIQVEWMKNADITPQHIYQGIMLILGKMMSK